MSPQKTITKLFSPMPTSLITLFLSRSPSEHAPFLFDKVTTREPPTAPSPAFADAFEQRNLPVDLAIKKFEMLNRKPSSPTTATRLARANTISSGGGGGSVSPSGLAANSASATLHRFNSLANNTSASVAER